MSTTLSWRDRLRLGLPLLPISGGVDIKGMADIAAKFVRVTQARAEDYKTGVQRTPPAKWEQRTEAAQPAWQAGVTQAAAENRFVAGVVGKGGKWQRKSTEVGAARFSTGVAASLQDYTTGFQRYHDILAGLTLPPRGPRGDPGNTNRVAVIDAALNQARRQRPRA